MRLREMRTETLQIAVGTLYIFSLEERLSSIWERNLRAEYNTNEKLITQLPYVLSQVCNGSRPH